MQTLSTNSLPNFYAYLWLRYDGTPYYVGKGHGKRAFVSREHSVRRPKTRNRIIVEFYPSEREAFIAEKFLISLYGRKDLGTGILWNRTDGGDGPSGAKYGPQTEARKQHISAKLKGRPKSPEHCRNISRGKLGLKQSFTHRENGRLARTGRIVTDETRRKMRLAWQIKKARQCLSVLGGG